MIGDGVVRHPWLTAIGFPCWPYLRTVARQSALLWALIRLAFAVVLFVTVGWSAVLHPDPGTGILAIGITPILVWWDRRRSHETLLHANLGVSPGWFWAVSLLTATILDVTVQALAGVP